MRVLKLVGASIGVLIILIAIVLVVGIPGGLLTDVIQNRVERQTGYRLEIETTTISLRPKPTIKLTGISLSDPQNRDGSIQLAVESAKAQFSLISLLTGKPRLDDLLVIQPILRAPLHRQRIHRSNNASSGNGTPANSDVLLRVGHIEVDDGTVVMADRRRGVENRLDKVALDATVDSDRKVTVTLNAETGGKPLGLEANATVPAGSLSDLRVPVDFKLKAPAVLTDQIAATANVKFDGSKILIDDVAGDLGGARFTGNASIDLESKPQVDVNLVLARLGLTKSDTPSSTASQTTTQPAQDDAVQPWSDAPIDLRGLNYVDGKVHLSVAELDLDTVKVAPIEIDAKLTDGVVGGTASNIGIYEGQAAAGVAMDVSQDTPSFAFRAELRQVHALPLLSSAADFTSLDGKLDSTINIQTTGGSARDMIANMSGVTNVKFADGEIRGINLAQMIRSLTSGTLSGWQQGQTENTDMTELGATFQINKGEAQTQDLQLAGPLVRVTGIGTIDLNTKAMNFRVEPKLVMSIQGQGGATDPVGLGVPVMIQGPWNHPHIFPDMAGILDNPDAAYAQLRQLGQGLFGPNFLQSNNATGAGANGNNGALNGNFVNNIGSMIKGITGSKTDQGQGAGSQGQGTASQGNAGQNTASGGQPAGQQTGNAATGGQTSNGEKGNGGQLLNTDQRDQLNKVINNLFGSSNQSK